MQPSHEPRHKRHPSHWKTSVEKKKNGNNKIKAQGEKEGTKMNHMLDVVSY